MTTYLFCFLSFVAIFCGLMVVFSKNPVNSILFLILTFFAIAGHYVLLNAQFLAAVHIIVYAGAIMVLFLYIIMMLNLNEETEPHKPKILKFTATISAGILMVVMIGVFKGADIIVTGHPHDSQIGMINKLGIVL